MLSFQQRENYNCTYLPVLVKNALREQSISHIESSSISSKEKYYAVVAIFINIIFKNISGDIGNLEAFCEYIDTKFYDFLDSNDGSFESEVSQYIYNNMFSGIYRKEVQFDGRFSLAVSAIVWVKTAFKLSSQGAWISQVLEQMSKHHNEAINSDDWLYHRLISTLIGPEKTKRQIQQTPKVWCPVKHSWVSRKVFDLITQAQ